MVMISVCFHIQINIANAGLTAEWAPVGPPTSSTGWTSMKLERENRHILRMKWSREPTQRVTSIDLNNHMSKVEGATHTRAHIGSHITTSLTGSNRLRTPLTRLPIGPITS